jgi:CRISPR-associated protein (TIGR02710 family)
VRVGTQGVERLPNIVTQAELGERFVPERDVFVVENPDEFPECYRVAAMAIRSAAGDEVELMADYTGGTKTMSVALAAAALDHQVPLYLTTGNRENLIKVERGEMSERVNVVPVLAQRVLERTLPELLRRYQFPAALAEIQGQLSSLYLPPDLKRHLRTLADLCRGLEAWDRFDHRTALQFLQGFTRYEALRPLVQFLQRVVSSRAKMDPEFSALGGRCGHGYEIVEDLLLNAQRRASQERYDDAVGRLYRAIELLVQVRLKLHYDQKTGELDTEKLPVALRSQYEGMRNDQGKVQLALERSYELLAALDGDPLGQLYSERRNSIRNALKARNHSLFAHGFTPVDATSYQAFQTTIAAFIQDGICALVPVKQRQEPVQFPGQLDFLL